MTRHNHADQERLTFGCLGCVERAEEARWANAPVRRCTWQCTYGIGRWAHRISFALDVKVPNGATWQQVDERYIDLTSEKFVMALLEATVPIDKTVEACETMEVLTVVIGPAIDVAGYEQDAML